MDFLKPYQGPGRNIITSTTNTNNNSNHNKNEEEDNECDLGFQVLTKAQTSSSEEDLKTTATSSGSLNPVQIVNTIAPSTSSPVTTAVTNVLPIFPPSIVSSCSTPVASVTTPASSTTTTPAGTLMLPIPSLPTVHLPPQLSNKPPVLTPMPALPTSMPTQIFPMPQLCSSSVKTAIPMPASSTASSVGCLIIEPQLFASADTFKKEFSASNIGLFHSAIAHAPHPPATTSSSRINPPLITKIRRVQPSPQTTAINLSFSAGQPPTSNQPPPAKVRKIPEKSAPDIDVGAILQANRDLDANTLFFLSLAKTVRSMPIKFQSLAKMRCMRIVSDIELELDNVNDCIGPQSADGANVSKFCTLDSPPPPPSDGTTILQHIAPPAVCEAATEHFVYVMSPSRVESMIDISSDDEATINGN